jgi:hypothetical protein
MSVIFLFMASIVFYGCKDDDNNGPATVSLSSSGGTVTESQGTVYVTVNLSKSVSTNTEIYYELGGTASLDGDYRVKTPSPISIAAGSATGTIQFEIIDESIIESTDEKIELTLKSTGANTTLNSSKSTYELVVQDNDVSDGDLHIDLTWNLGEGKDIDDVNLDLYLATNVTISDNTVTDATLYKSSKNSTGFETLKLQGSEPDDEYYIVVAYTSGNKDVSFTLNLNGFGYTNEATNDSFKSSESGYAAFYGPLKKSGSTLGRMKPFIRYKSSPDLHTHTE